MENRSAGETSARGAPYNVKLFARARELAGSSEVQVALTEPATVGALRTALSQQHPALAALAPVLLVAVGNDYARDADPLPRDRPIACFPPVSGG